MEPEAFLLHPSTALQQRLGLEMLSPYEEEKRLEDVATQSGISKHLLERLVNGEVAIDEELAERLGKTLGPSSNYWLGLQKEFDEFLSQVPVVSYALENRVIILVPYEWAPKELQDLSTHYGDEDWIAVIPDEVEKLYYVGLENVAWFGSRVKCLAFSEGKVCIGAHA